MKTRTVGQTGVDVSVNGGATSFSTSTETATLTVNPVNDDPVNSIPLPQSTRQNTSLVFNAANSNLISIADVEHSHL